MCSLPTACATSEIAWVAGSPLFRVRARLRENRPSAALCSSRPITGNRSTMRSQVRRPARLASQPRALQRASAQPASTSGQKLTMKSDMPIRICVISGRSTFMLL